jgi:hypothetical protein
MATEGWNVKQEYHIFMKVLLFYFCAVFGINVLNYFTARYTGSFNFLVSFAASLFAVSWFTVRNIVYSNIDLGLKHVLR